MAPNTVVNVQVLSPPPTNVVLGKRGRDDSTDYSQPIPYPYTKEVVEAMRLRILQLENELRAVKKQKTSAAATPKTAANAVAGPATTAAPAQDAKADAKTVKTRTKSLFDQIKKAAKGEKYQNTVRTVKIEEHFTQPDFELVFGNSGTLIQPTPTNKPTSSVWIRRYTNETDLRALFGDSYKRDQLKGHQWTVGGIHQGKSQKLPNAVQLEIHSVEVQWSKNQSKATLKVEISEEDMDKTCLGRRGGMWVFGGF
ncbi:hypothetical protein PHLGIDRAFT_37614 [Phlebiopsis gigantea 11061_1 CR5-6]|uniref:Uncharacterized protein n=1 Tax=Phlebiopsis gigantea (strain 11061_1 CR5-6) TaxID=745531 RepID=A0A0C3NEJ0_PHLG1|nr:hypothetical protein PHLGIDRAFT_37614 [Phlebiopsis gigantea 11061_1 CR5-6]